MAQAESKTDKALRLHKEGKYREALRIFKTFRIGFSKEEKRTVEIAAEVLAGREAFYRSLGIDTQSVVKAAISTINAKYC